MDPKSQKVKVVLVDDHRLFRKGMVELINAFPDFNVIWEADNGHEFIRSLKEEGMPDVVLLDIAMPEMDGFQTAEWLKNNMPKLKFLTLSMYDSEEAIIRMMRLGARGYILKDTDPEILHHALKEIVTKGFFYSETVSMTLLHAVQGKSETNHDPEIQLSSRELEFLKLACTELTYKEIADKMFLSARTIDGYREALFEKLKVKSRVGLVLYAFKNKIIEAG